MNRRKKKLARHAGAPVKYPAKVKVITDEKSQHEYICEGCDRVHWGKHTIMCKVYTHVPSYFIRVGCCAFNRQRALPRNLKKVRVGQQKQRRGI